MAQNPMGFNNDNDLNTTKILFFRVNVAVMMAPVCSACQNAENALFKKSQFCPQTFKYFFKNLGLIYKDSPFRPINSQNSDRHYTDGN